MKAQSFGFGMFECGVFFFYVTVRMLEEGEEWRWPLGV
jgi:hypothetical protein